MREPVILCKPRVMPVGTLKQGWELLDPEERYDPVSGVDTIHHNWGALVKDGQVFIRTEEFYPGDVRVYSHVSSTVVGTDEFKAMIVHLGWNPK